MPAKLTQKQVEEIFADKECTLLDRYQGNSISMRYICSCGNENAKTSLVGFRNSKGCYQCSEVSGGRRLSLEDVKQYFIDQDCEYLEDTYKNSVTLVAYRCVCNTIATTTVGTFRDGRRCSNCRDKANSERFRTPYEEVKQFFEDHGCELLETEYKDNKTKMSYRCKCDRIRYVTYGNFQRCPNCKVCGSDKIRGENCYMYDPDREAVAERKRFRKSCAQFLKRALESTGQSKNDHTYKMLGYTAQELQDHIYNHPDYDPVIDWKIDHIFPIKAFEDHGIKDLKLINCLENLRPLENLANLYKADKYDTTEFRQWLLEKSGWIIEQSA